MTAVDPGLPELARRHPEWKPWLTVIEEILREAPIPGGTPLFRPDEHSKQSSAARRSQLVLERVWFAAVGTADPERLSERNAKMATLEPALRAEVDLSTCSASLCQMPSALEKLGHFGADAEAFQAVAALLPSRSFRRATAVGRCRDRNWSEGYCPLCGAWPALAEVRGIERSRYLRCGRCGAEWEAHVCLAPTAHDRP